MTESHAPGNYAVRRTYTPNYGAHRPTEYGGQTTRYPKSVQDFPVVNNDDPERVHPTQKPVALMEYMIETYSLPGATVLDFTMGSGTTGVACQNTGRAFIGVEKDETYFQHASRRLGLLPKLEGVFA